VTDTEQDVRLGCDHCGKPLSAGRRFCSIACRGAWQRAQPRHDPNPLPPDPLPPGLARNRPEVPCGREESPLRIPVIQRATDVNLRDCFVVWCVCGYQSLPYVDLEVAEMMAWRHSFGWRISDMRVDPNEIATNGNGHEHAV